MPPFDYESIASSALETVRTFGVAYRIERSDDDYDPATGATTGNPPFGGEITCINLPPPGNASEGKGMFSQEQVAQAEAYLLAAAKGAPFEPKSGDILYREEGKRWEVIASSALAPNGIDAVIYNLLIKRA